jgi:hypothetical protein
LSSLGLNRLLLVEIGCLLSRLASEAGICDLRLRLGLAILLSVLMLPRRTLDLRLSLVWYILISGSGTLNLVLVRCPQRHPLHTRDYTLGRSSGRARARGRHVFRTRVELLIGLAGLNAVLLLHHATTALCLVLNRL